MYVHINSFKLLLSLSKGVESLLYTLVILRMNNQVFDKLYFKFFICSVVKILLQGEANLPLKE